MDERLLAVVSLSFGVGETNCSQGTVIYISSIYAFTRTTSLFVLLTQAYLYFKGTSRAKYKKHLKTTITPHRFTERRLNLAVIFNLIP